jgi:hypothetical protein
MRTVCAGCRAAIVDGRSVHGMCHPCAVDAIAAQAKEMSRDDLDIEIDRHRATIRDYRDDGSERPLEQINDFYNVLLAERRFRILFNDEDYTRN